MGNQAVKVVLTGGPCSGKTSILNSLRKKEGFFVAPEMATILFEANLSDEGNRLEHFQASVLQLQREMERVINFFAWNFYQNSVVVYDRGAMDGKAFCSQEEWKR